jgi:hypothetical protein
MFLPAHNLCIFLPGFEVFAQAVHDLNNQIGWSYRMPVFYRQTKTGCKLPEISLLKESKMISISSGINLVSDLV